MSTLRFLLRSVGGRALLLAPLGLVGALCSAGLMAVIHRALTGHVTLAAGLPAFVGFGFGRVVATYASSMGLGNHAAKSVTALRRELARKLLAVPHRELERIGMAGTSTILTRDMQTLESAIASVPGAVTAAAVLFGGTAYLAYVDPRLFAALLVLVLPAWAIFRVAARAAAKVYARQRDAYQKLTSHFEALTRGTKELKLHAPRRTEFLESALHGTTEELLEADIESRSRYARARVLNQTLLLVVLASTLFVVPRGLGVSTDAGTGYVLVGLYLLGPLMALTNLWPAFQAAELALSRIDALGVHLRAEGVEPEVDAKARLGVVEVELRDASYRYGDERAFQLGPLRLTLSPGEILFVVGGNGSGKSTLGRLLTGLYAPTTGELRWDERVVNNANRDAYRQLWSAVFPDAHLFDRLYGFTPQELSERAPALLTRLGLEGRVRVQDGTFSSLDLSHGERKRLALFVALLEDRPLYLFDEWAADQDPEWKRIFYRDLLPELRAHGKAVVVITHDDRYFDAADRVLHLADGKPLA